MEFVLYSACTNMTLYSINCQTCANDCLKTKTKREERLHFMCPIHQVMEQIISEQLDHVAVFIDHFGLYKSGH